MAGRRSSAASFVLLSAATLLLALASSRSPFVTAQDSSSSSSSSPSTSGCILPFDVDEVPATAGGLVTSPDGSKQELSLGASALGKLSLSGRLALALPGAAACPGDGKALLEALPGAKLIDVEGATGLRISPNPVKAKVREREEERRKEREREKRERERESFDFDGRQSTSFAEEIAASSLTLTALAPRGGPPPPAGPPAPPEPTTARRAQAVTGPVPVSVAAPRR